MPVPGPPVPQPVLAAAPPAPPAASLRDQIRSALAHVAPDASNAAQVAAELSSILNSARQAFPGGPDELMRVLPDEFTEAFCAAAFDPGLIPARRGSAAFVHVLSALADPYSKAVSPMVVRKTLGQVTKKRAEDAPRESFALQSEAFATLAATGLVANFDGALVSMERVLRKPENRAAAIATLCHIIQQSELKLASGAAKAATLRSLLASVDSLGSDPRWAGEVAFLRSKLMPLLPGAAAPPAAAAAGPRVPVPVPVPVPAPAPVQQGPPMPVPVPVPMPVPTPAPAPAPAAPPAAPALASVPKALSLQAISQIHLPGGAIFSLCYEAGKQQLIVGGKDMPLHAFRPSGEPLANFPHPNQYVCTVDTFPQHNVALSALSSVPESGQAAGIQIFNTNPWSARATISRPGTDMLACLRCLPQTNLFVTGESLRTNPSEAVCLYDLGAALSAGVNAQPLHEWREHTDLISCISAMPINPNLFLTGSRDMTIRLWDARARDRSVGLLGQHQQPEGPPAAHTQMVSCIDASSAEPLVVSSALDGFVAAWDLRRIGGVAGPVLNVQVDGQAVLKVALADSPYPRLAAVATTWGVYALDIVASGEVLAVDHVVTANLFQDVTIRQFNDIKWGARGGRPVLFAACSDRPRVDVLEVTA